MDKLKTFTDLARRFFYLRKLRFQSKGRGKRQASCTKWNRIGSGYYGEAWQHVDYPEYVIKISGPAGWGRGHFDKGAVYSGIRYQGKRLDAWPVFARHCQQHPHKHLPKILHFEQATEALAWAVMPCYQDWEGQVNGFSQVVNWLRYDASDAPEWLWPLKQMANSLYFQVDLHDENVMWDEANQTFVIIDPFSSTGESNAT